MTSAIFTFILISCFLKDISVKGDCKVIEDRQNLLDCIESGCKEAHELCEKLEDNEEVFRRCAEKTVKCQSKSHIDYELEIFDEIIIPFEQSKMKYGRFCAHFKEIFIFKQCLQDKCKDQKDECDRDLRKHMDLYRCLLDVHDCQKPAKKKIRMISRSMGQAKATTEKTDGENGEAIELSAESGDAGGEEAEETTEVEENPELDE